MVYRDAKMTMTAMSKRKECEIRRKKDGRVSRKIVINGGLFRGRSINTILVYNDRRTSGKGRGGRKRGPSLVMGER